MKIQFCGASSGVTGSCHLITTEKHKILLDCGQFQGGKAQEALNYEEFPFDPAEIEYMVLSHAHIDHCGRIPLLIKRGFKGSIYCTDATADLLDVMLKDSGYIHEKEAQWKNKKNERAGRPLVEPLYTYNDAVDSLKYVKPVLYDQLIELNDEMKIVFNDAGHILGSAITELWVTEGDSVSKIVFSGDLGVKDKADTERSDDNKEGGLHHHGDDIRQQAASEESAGCQEITGYNTRYSGKRRNDRDPVICSRQDTGTDI